MGMQNHRLSPTWKKTFVHSIPRNPLVVSTLYSGTHILPQFSSGYLKKGWAPCPGSKCEPYLSSTCFCFFFFSVYRVQKDDTSSPNHPKPISHSPWAREVQEKQTSGSHHSKHIQKLPGTTSVHAEAEGTETQQATGGAIHTKGIQQVFIPLCPRSYLYVLSFQ